MNIASIFIQLLCLVMVALFGAAMYFLIKKQKGKKDDANKVPIEAKLKWKGWIWPVIKQMP